MQCTQNIKFCGFKLSKKAKKRNIIYGNSNQTQSQATNSSSGVISDLSDVSQPGQNCNLYHTPSNMLWKNNGRNSCNIFSNSLEYPSRLSICPTDMSIPGHSKPYFNNNFRSMTPSNESFMPFSSISTHNVSRISISSSDKYPSLHSLSIRNVYRNDFKFLRVDLLSKILQYLSINDLCRSSRVCKHWYSVVWNQNMWNKLDMTKCVGDSKINISKGIDTILKILSYKTYPFCPSLTIINLSKCQITDEDLLRIANKCPELQTLSLSGNLQIQDSSISHLLVMCRRMYLLSLSRCSQISYLKLLPRSTQNSIAFARNTLDNLKYIDLSYCRRIDDNSVSLFAPLLKRLRKLILKECLMITDIGLKGLVKNCQHLKHLDISGCCFVTDKGVSLIITNLPLLRRLSISKCHKITDNSISIIPNSNSQISELIIRNCSSITINSLQLLKDFKLLDLSDNCHLTKQNVLQIASNNQYTLRYLIINKFDNLTGSFLRDFFQICVRLKYIDVKNCKFVDSTYLRSYFVTLSVLNDQLNKL